MMSEVLSLQARSASRLPAELLRSCSLRHPRRSPAWLLRPALFAAGACAVATNGRSAAFGWWERT